ncbi:MAG: tripartite tricarboxylate transporter permease, partial [Candidatus Competibacterales bacterium]
VLGAIPGLTATMGVALLVPVTFFLEPIQAIAAIVTLAAVAIFAGDIPGALLRIPGTPASAAYVDDAYRLTQKGQGERALGLSLGAAVLGGLLGSVVLVIAAPALAEVALRFSSAEYFWLACLGLSCAALVSPGNPLKGTASLLLGLFIATIGFDVIAGHPRFTFGEIELMGGVNFIPAMIGMFALSEVLRKVTAPQVQRPQDPGGGGLSQVVPLLWRYRLNALRGGGIGTLVGALPGAGADIAAWIAYAVGKRQSRTPEAFGRGHPEGLVDAGAANNGGLSGAWVPALVFGIPGDAITAIVIGVLFLKGLQPGPTIFVDQADLLYAIFISFFVANLLLLPLGLLAIKTSRHLLAIPQGVLLPVVLLFCIVGAYAINNSTFDVGIMLVMGLLGYVMEENDFPVAPAILGIVLGQLVENHFITTLIKSQGDFGAFFQRPIAAGLGVVTLLLWCTPVVLALLARRRRAAARAKTTPKTTQ